MDEELSYKPLIEDMTWSYTRVSSFETCPHQWFLKYLKRCKSQKMFYASFGSYIHKLLEQYYKGELPKEKMAETFLAGFQDNVKGYRPKESVVKNYIQSGVDYLLSFHPFPYEMVAVEHKMDFDLNGYKFTGIIDYLGRDKDGELVVIDNKSRRLKPRSGRKIPTRSDEELDTMLKQLYIYSAGVEQEFGKLPKKLCFNCFRNGVFIEEPFCITAYESAVKEAKEAIKAIEDETEFEAKPSFFTCFWLCDVSGDCETWINRR
mgnify:FL=1